MLRPGFGNPGGIDDDVDGLRTGCQQRVGGEGDASRADRIGNSPRAVDDDSPVLQAARSQHGAGSLRVEIGDHRRLHTGGLRQLHDQTAAELAGADHGHSNRIPLRLALL